MKRRVRAILAVFLTGTALAGCAPASETAPPSTAMAPASMEPTPRLSMVENVRSTAKVRGVDKAARTVILQFQDGREEAVTAGSGVRNFDRIKVGDTVQIEYARLTNIVTQPPGGGPGAVQRSSTDRAAVGEMPRASAITTTQVTEVVEAIDLGRRMVTLRGPQGRTRTVPVPPDVQGLETVKPGDEVVISRTEAATVTVMR
ncbi:hypothetical protein TSH58p_27075 (plasmid) [Azospirillum sp. TSH58]|uniref:hypothetical protein n=1 Tax=Azospirillum sp. TSH58 TaxID=664962 RepID=UPI000D600255|nr:hypothetical protein [Azospirillum sp. TSH58]AWJ87074.1 hypothetical protein TSH58p_27075 [Azospirillum sp. TSH58]PWC66924.1 hypothetical protein TSH58_19345 [Azospirillum sp. TSH58]